MSGSSNSSNPLQHRMVLYEELAEYYYRIIASDRLKKSNIKNEVRYHVQNITLLSLYFDKVLITSATIFNAEDAFIAKIISEFLAHNRVREMLQLGVLKIVGWGGQKPKEMFDAAATYSDSVLRIRKGKQTLAQLESVFSAHNVISRAPAMPDLDLAEKYKRRLSDTYFMSNKSEIRKVYDAVHKQQDNTGSLIAIEMIPSLERANITQELLDKAKIELFGVTMEHMKGEIPGLWVYSPFLASTFSSELTYASPGAPRAFLLSPMVFGSFLNMNIDGKTFHLLMNQSYLKLQKLKNGDWAKFVKAYHEAVSEISSSITLGMHLSSNELMAYGAKEWAENIISAVEKEESEVDIAAFVESLGSLGGVLMAVPFLSPLARVISVALGDRLSKWVKGLSAQHRSQVSPFIQKIQCAYLN